MSEGAYRWHGSIEYVIRDSFEGHYNNGGTASGLHLADNPVQAGDTIRTLEFGTQ